MALDQTPQRKALVDGMREYIQQNGTYEFARVVRDAVEKLPDCEIRSEQREVLTGIIEDVTSVRDDIKVSFRNP